MKTISVLSILIFGFAGALKAQKIEKFFDYKWRECPANMARFYAVIENTDSGWLRRDYFLAEKKLQMKGLYMDSACKIANGYFYFFHPNGLLSSTGQYVNNKKQGLWFGFHPNGFMNDSTVYESGEKRGTSLQWHSNGYVSDSTVVHEDGSAVSVSWFDDGTASSAGRLNFSNKQHGKWQFFHKNGKPSALEIYDNGKLVDRKYFSEDGTPVIDTTEKTHPPSFRGGIETWVKYLQKQLYFPAKYEIINGDKAVVVIDFTVDENGEIKDVALQTPFHPAFDEIAMKIIKNAPKWYPAMNHNRKVKYQHRQVVNFEQTTY